VRLEPVCTWLLLPSCPAICRPLPALPWPAGPLLQRATSLVFEGVPTYPTPSRCWEVVDKWQARTALFIWV